MRNNTYDLRQYWLSFYSNTRPYLVSDPIWEYYCDIFEKTFNWKTDYDVFMNFLKENEIETLPQCQDYINLVTDNIIKKVNLKKLYSKEYEQYSNFIINIPDGYYFKIDLCDASFNYFIKNDVIKEKEWSEFVGTNDDFLNSKVFKHFVYNKINYSHRYCANKQYLDNILNSDSELIYNLKNVEHSFFYLGDALLFNFHNDNDMHFFKKEITPFLEINGEAVHTSIYKKQTLLFNKILNKHNSQISIIDDITTGKLEIKKYNFIDFQMYLPQIQKLYLGEKITDNDLLWGYYDKIHKFEQPLSLI